MDQKLTSVHDALQRASLAGESQTVMGVRLVVRVDAELKQQVTEVCEAHGTTVSEFVRQCCQGIIHDYTGEPLEE